MNKNNKWTNETVDQRLANRTLVRLGNYINYNTKINFKCKICDHIWAATPSRIFRNRGCPKCSGHIRLTNIEIDNRLKNIIRLDNYINKTIKMNWQCKACNFIWKTIANSVLNNKTGCPKCAGNAKLDNKTVDERLIDKTIIRIGNYISSKIKIKFKCLICTFEWLTDPSSVILNNCGCPKCSKYLKWTNKTLDIYLIPKNITRLENYINSYIKINFQCKLCDNIWKTAPANLLYDTCGCPKCGLRKNEKLINKLLSEYKIEYISQKSLKQININTTKNLKMDFWISNKNLIIEYNGAQHYRPVKFGNITDEAAQQNFEKQKLRDQYLTQFCKENAINLLWIDGRKYQGKKLETYVLNKLIPSLK